MPKHLQILATNHHKASKLSDEYYSFRVYDEVTKLAYWVDVSRDSYGDITTDWNQYIFYTTDDGDVIRRDRQADDKFFMEVDEVVSEEYERLEGIKKRLEYLRQEIEAERISYGEIAELQSLAGYIDKDDVQLLEWAGVPEHK